MKQSQILQLLKEASCPTCTPRQLKHILELLARNAEYNDPSGFTVRIVTALFNQVAQHQPSAFPEQFPAFAVLCGDTVSGARIAGQIDWSLVPALLAAA